MKNRTKIWLSQDARPLDRDDASDEDDGGPIAPNWEPASRDADPASGNRGGGDILSMLVSIYGSKARWCYLLLLYVGLDYRARRGY